MSILRKVVSDSLFSGFRMIVSISRGLIVIPLITNLLGAGSYGIWTTILSITSLFSATGSLHLHGALIRYGSRDQQKEETYADIIFLTFGIAIVVSALAGAIGIAVDLKDLLQGNVDEELLLVFTSCILIFTTMIWRVNSNFPRAKGNVKKYDILRIVKNVLESVGLLVVFITGNEIITGMILLIIISIILNICLFIYIFHFYVVPKPSISRYKKYMSYSMPLVPQMISSKLLENTDKYLIIYFLSPTSLGIYAVTYSISSTISRFTTVLGPTLYPTISSAWDNKKYENISEIYTIIFRWFSILVIPAIAGMTILAEPLLTLLSTEEIAEEGTSLIPILVIAFAIKGAHSPLQYILTASENTGKIAATVISGTILNIILNIFLIPSHKLIGASIATATSALLILVLIHLYSSKKISYSIPYITVVRTITATIIMCFMLIFIPIRGSYLQLILFPIVGVCTYFLVLLIIGEFDRDEIGQIKSFMRNNR